MSRYAFCWDKTISGNVEKLPRGRFLYRKFQDTVTHVCKDGETLWGLASRYYGNDLPGATLLFWIIGDFQPVPVVDPSLHFTSGDVVYIPSIRVVKLYLEDPAREPEFEAW